MKFNRSWPFFLGLFIIFLDMGTKYWTQSHLPLMTGEYPYGGIPIFKDFFGIEFSWVHQTNRGAAWGLGAEYQMGLMVARIILVTALIFYALFFNKKVINILGFTLVIAGALGNIIDYFVYGHVIDMFHFVLWGYDYPVFNVADSAITLGILWLIYASYK